MKFNYCLSLLLLLFLLSCSENSKKQVISDKNKSVIDVDRYIEMAKEKDEPKTKKVLIDLALNKTHVLENTPQLRNSLAKIAYEYYFLRDIEGIGNSSLLLLKQSKEANDLVNLGVAYRSRGFYFNTNKVLDSSFYYYHKAEKLYDQLKDKPNFANMLLFKGIVQYKVGDNLGAELTATRAYNIFNDLNDDKNLYQIFILLGNISEELKEFDKAVVYYTKALEKGSELEKGDGIDRKAICYNNIGFVHIKLNDHKKAIYNFNEGLKFSDKINQPDIYANLLDNLAYSKFKLNNQDGLPQMFFAALKIRDSLKFSSSIVLSHLHLSQYFAKNNDKIRSQKHVMVALQISRETKIPIDILTSLNQASEVDKANADEYSKEYIRLSDSLHIAERKSKDRFASLALQTDEIRQEKEVLAEKNRNLLLGFGITAIIAGLLFIVRLQRTRTRELLYKQSQQKANEEIYNLMISQQAIIDESREKEKKRLAQDLHDGILGRMFGLRLNLDSLNSFTDGETVQRRLELLSELKTIEQDIREISHDLNREKQVLINNFVSIVHNLLEEQQSFHEAKLNFSIDNRIDWDKVGNTVKINLYRILQECLQNINKYANAKNIGIKISREAENVALIISDDGVGFDVSRKSKGIGMQNMVSRTHECKGVIDVRSGRGNGTTILITIPIETNQLIEL